MRLQFITQDQRAVHCSLCKGLLALPSCLLSVDEQLKGHHGQTGAHALGKSCGAAAPNNALTSALASVALIVSKLPLQWRLPHLHSTSGSADPAE